MNLRTVHVNEVSGTGTRLVIEASQLQLKPGQWPKYIGVVGDNGEGEVYRLAYRFAGLLTPDGKTRSVTKRDVTAAVYSSPAGELHVLND